MSNKTFLTQEGFNKLTEELTILKDRQNHLVTQIEEVALPDESGEDGLSAQLKEELEVVNDKIDKLEEALEMSQIITTKSLSKTEVQVGSTVKIKISGATIKMFNIVTHLEADPTNNKISDQSPLGQALIGKKLNETVEVSAPVGKITYKIVAIN